MEAKMKQWKYLRLILSDSGINIQCTENDILNSIVAIAKTLVPTCSTKVIEKIPDGEAFSMFVSQLQNQDYSIGYLIVRKLCRDGWELISAGERRVTERAWGGEHYESFGGFEYHFKFEVE